MSNISLVKSFYDKVSKLFNHAVLRLEVKEYSNTYIVDVAPLDVYNDKLYIELEKCFRKEFEELNTDASILFVSEKSLVRADNPIISFLPTIDVEKEIKLEFSFNCNSINNENYSNSYMGYAIAA
mgnify:CR=1 FL=1